MTHWQWVPTWVQAIAHALPLSLRLSTCQMGWTYDPGDTIAYPTVASVVCQSTTGGPYGVGRVILCTWKGCS